MEVLAKNWFSELGPLWPGQCMSLEIEKVLYDQKSPYQHVQVFQSKSFGKVLALDGVIQVTERDEFAYQEMLSHLPLCAHENPKRVLVIGGGDGGVLREVARHDTVEEITICEIDEMVINVSKQFLPGLGVGFSDPRVKVYVGDGAEYMKQHKNEFDVIIVDSSDPIGPAETLFREEFYHCMDQALRPKGIVCAQGECQWLSLDLIENMLKFSSTMFPHVEYAYTCIPTYPCGQIGFIICSKGDICSVPKRKLDVTKLRYYNEDIHKAAFVLPQFARAALKNVLKQ